MKDAILVITLGLVLIIAPTFGIIGCSNYSTMPNNLAKIEQLRSDAAVVDPNQAEDVIGQVTEWNQVIRSNQVWNDSFWGFLIPDEWDSIELIQVPR